MDIQPLMDLVGAEPDPDFGRLETVLRRAGEPDRVPFIELFADQPIMEAILGRPLWPRRLEGRQAQTHYLDALIEYHLRMGYDYVGVGGLMGFPRKENPSASDTAELSMGERHWYNAEVVTIANADDLANYAWPEPAKIDLFPLRYVAEHLPRGMRIIGMGPGGVLENVMWLVGYEGLSFALVDDFPFVERVFQEVGSRLLGCVERMLEVPEVAAVFLGDDMGFKTQTMISPDELRELVFPWHRRMVVAAHRAGRPFLLHACGNLTAVMEDIIDIGFDAKHSFEDVIEPVTVAKQRWGDRIALLGGADVDFLCRASEAQIREYVRRVLRECGPGGGYALGTGNSVANYIPAKNFLVMMEEGWHSATYPIHC